MIVHIALCHHVTWGENRLNRDGTYFLSEADAPRVYVRTSPLIRFHSLVSRPTLPFRRALTPDFIRVVCDKRSRESVNTVSSQKSPAQQTSWQC